MAVDLISTVNRFIFITCHFDWTWMIGIYYDLIRFWWNPGRMEAILALLEIQLLLTRLIEWMQVEFWSRSYELNYPVREIMTANQTAASSWKLDSKQFDNGALNCSVECDVLDVADASTTRQYSPLRNITIGRFYGGPFWPGPNLSIRIVSLWKDTRRFVEPEFEF